jgi:hypothetical protein
LVLTAAWFSEIGCLPHDNHEVGLGPQGDQGKVGPEQVNRSAHQWQDLSSTLNCKSLWELKCGVKNRAVDTVVALWIKRKSTMRSLLVQEAYLGSAEMKLIR